MDFNIFSIGHVMLEHDVFQVDWLKRATYAINVWVDEAASEKSLQKYDQNRGADLVEFRIPELHHYCGVK